MPPRALVQQGMIQPPICFNICLLRAAVRHVLEALEPYSEENGGPLKIQHVSFVEGRGNIIVEYPGQDPSASGIISFVGAHMDVVTANPDLWEFDPFTLTRDGDQLRGRGTTDCLGHVRLAPPPTFPFLSPACLNAGWL